MSKLTSPFDHDRLSVPLNNGCGSPYEFKCTAFRSLDPNFGRIVNDRVPNGKSSRVTKNNRKSKKVKKEKSIKLSKKEISIISNPLLSVNFGNL